jgi:hypothetical protein
MVVATLARWPRAACAITSAAAFTATRSTSAGGSALREDALRPGAARARADRASQAAADPLLAAVADDPWPVVDLSDAGGGFCSAEDADSIPRIGGGGRARLEARSTSGRSAGSRRCSARRTRVVALRFGGGGRQRAVRPAAEFTGRTCSTAATFEDAPASTGRSTTSSTWPRARPVLLEARNRRPRPRSTTRC